VEILRLWTAVTSADSNYAKRAFDRLVEELTPRLKHYLIRSCRSIQYDDREEIVNMACARLWESRHTTVVRSEQAVFALLRKTADNLCIDHWRKRRDIQLSQLQTEEGLDVDDPDDINIEMDAIQRDLYHQILRCADVRWLRVDANSTEGEIAIRQAIASMFFDDGDEMDDIIDTHRWNLKQYYSTVNNELIFGILYDPATIRMYVYRKLMLNRLNLLKELLHNSALTDATVTDAWNSSTVPEAVPEWEEVVTAAARYYFGLSPESAIERVTSRWPEITTPAIQKILNVLSARLPYARMALETRQQLEAHRQDIVGLAEINAPPLWQRMAFQYRYQVDLQVNDIVERISQPGQQFGFALSHTTAQAWISQHRLLDQVEKVWQELYNRKERFDA
jgi:DNA-directed RNA polymerase specialized sigma24 family protein